MKTRSPLLGYLTLVVCVGILPPARVAGHPPETKATDSGAPQASTPAERKYLQTNYIFNRGHYELAIPEYEKLLKEHPDYPQKSAVHYALALCHFHIYEKLTLGGSQGKLGKSDPAQHLRQALRYSKLAVRDKSLKTRDEATLLLGRCLLFRREAAAAIKVLRWTHDRAKKRSARAEAALGLGEAYLQQADLKTALPHLAYARKNGGTAAIREQAAFQYALATYQGAQQVDTPETPDTTTKQSGVTGGQKSELVKEMRDALKTFQEIGANRKSPLQNDALYMAGLILSSQGQYDAARPSLQALLTKDPTRYDELARLTIAQNAFESGRLTSAGAELDTLVKKYPDSPRATEFKVLLSRVLLELGKQRAAEELLQPLTQAGALPADAALPLSRALRGQGKHSEATRMLQSVLAESKTPEARLEVSLELGAAHAEAGDYALAAEQFTNIVAAHSKSPRAPYAAYMQAHCLHAARQHESSNRACESFLSKWPESGFANQVRELEAENLFFLQKYEDAEVRYRRLLSRKSPVTPASDASHELALIKARFRLAQIAFFAGKAREAAAALKSIAGDVQKLGIDITTPEAAFLLTERYYSGLALVASDKAAEAAAALREYLQQTSKLDAAQQTSFAAQVDDARYQLGRALAVAKDPSARKVYEEALQLNPKSPHRHAILFELARLSFDAGDAMTARQTLTPILDDNPPADVHARARFLLGSIAEREKKPEAAVTHFRFLADSFPDHPLAPDARLRLARALRATGDAAGAKKVLADFAAKHADHKDLGAFLLEGALAAVETAPAQGLKDLQELEANPAARPLRIKILYEKAWCYRALKDGKSAAATYETLLRTPTANETDAALVARAGLELAELKFDTGDYRGALTILENPAGGTPVNEDTLYRLCWCYHKLGNAPQTIATFERLRKSYPESTAYPETAILAAKAYFEGGRTDKARALFETVAANFGTSPEAPLAQVSIGECLMKEREFAKAAQLFATFVQQHGASELVHRAHFGLGWCAENLGDIDKALGHYAKVTADYRSPSAPRAQFQTGQCYVTRKDYQRAIVEFLKVPATYKAPEWSSKAMLQVAGCFEALGDDAKATAYYNEVISKYSNRSNEVALAKRRLQRLNTR